MVLVQALLPLLLLLGGMAGVLLSYFRPVAIAGEVQSGVGVGVLTLAGFGSLFVPEVKELNQLIAVDAHAKSWMALSFLSCACVLIMMDTKSEQALVSKQGSALCMLLIGACAGLAAISRSLWLVFIAIEVLAVTLVILTNLSENKRWNEPIPQAMLRPNLVGTGLMLIGLVLLFARGGGSLQFDRLQLELQALTGAEASLWAIGVFAAGVFCKMFAAVSQILQPARGMPAPAHIVCVILTTVMLAVTAALARLVVESLPGQSSLIRAVLPLACIAVTGWFSIQSLRETDFNRLLISLAMSQVAVGVFALAAASQPSLQGLLHLATISTLAIVGISALITMLGRFDVLVEDLNDVARLVRSNFVSGLLLLFLLLALAGLPPMSGFLSRIMIFRATHDAGMASLSTAMLIAWSISALATIRVLGIAVRPRNTDFVPQARSGSVKLASACLAVLVLCLVMAAPFSGWADRAASSLF